MFVFSVSWKYFYYKQRSAAVKMSDNDCAM